MHTNFNIKNFTISLQYKTINSLHYYFMRQNKFELILGIQISAVIVLK